MKNEMMEKINNLRDYLNKYDMNYEMLISTLRNHKEFPSISTLRKYDLLIIKREDEWEDTVDEGDYDKYDDSMDDYEWDEEREVWYSMKSERYYGIR